MKACTARTKTEAKRLAHDLERQAERQRHGLEDMPAADGGGTVAQLLARWLAGRPDAPFASRDTSAVRRHLLGSELADIPLARLRGHDNHSRPSQFSRDLCGDQCPGRVGQPGQPLMRGALAQRGDGGFQGRMAAY